MSNTTIVVGASRGLGRGIAEVLADGGMPVIAVARGAIRLETVQTVVAGPAGDSEVAGNAVVELLRKAPETVAAGYLLTGAGLKELP